MSNDAAGRHGHSGVVRIDTMSMNYPQRMG